jgi:hypothetical protein
MAVSIAPFLKTKTQAAELRMSGSCSLLVLRINFLGLCKCVYYVLPPPLSVMAIVSAPV